MLGAFEGCANITEVRFPSGFVEIGKAAFYGCCGLAGFEAPDTLAKVRDDFVVEHTIAKVTFESERSQEEYSEHAAARRVPAHGVILCQRAHKDTLLLALLILSTVL